MNADQLLAHYEQVADAPDAISRLRRFILDLAVRGKLMEQNANDEPTSELLKRIEVERKERVARGEIKRAKPLNSITRAPFDPPSDWTWLPLGETGNIFTGNSINAATREQLEKTVEGRPFIATKDVGYGFDEIDYTNGLLVELSDERFKIARSDSVLICAEGGSAGRKIALTDREISFGNKLLANETWGVISPKFVLCVYLSDFFYAQFAEKMTGVIGGISLRNFLQLPFPLPPLAEQHRIAAKVDELMALCDRLEAARADREATRDRLAAASLALLGAPDPNPMTFQNHTTFALDNLARITSRLDQIKTLRQTILNLAVRGKLVEQDPTDEPVEHSLRAIRSNRDEMIRNKELRREKPVSTVVEDTAPFDIPDNWKWVRVGDLALFTQYGTSAKAAPSDTGVPVLTMGNIQDGAVIRTNEKRIPDTSDELSALYLKNFDLLYNRTNSAELVGKTGLYQGEDDCLTFASYLIRIRISADHTSPIYVNLAMNAPDFRTTQIVPHIKKQTGQANVNGSALKNMLTPLPPLAEQLRIVAKVDELMTLCDRLEAALAQADTTRQRLLEALLHGRVASITGQARSTLTRENGQPTDSNLAQPSSVILLRARTPICASVF